MTNIGFIGLGDMGGPMAKHIAKGPEDMWVFDAAGTKARAPEGTHIAQSTAEIAQNAELVLLSLPNGDASLMVANEIVAAKGQTQILVDLSTIGLAAAKEMAEILAAHGITYIDAPVSGGVGGAKKGTITLMWSGNKAALKKHKDLFKRFTGSIFEIGDRPGQGQAMKLLNNFLSATAMAATSEAIHFGEAHGLDMESMLNVLNVSTGRNTATSGKFPQRVLTGSFDAGFRMALMAKDVDLYQQAVCQTGTSGETAALMHKLWQQADQDRPDTDFTEIFKALDKP